MNDTITTNDSSKTGAGHESEHAFEGGVNPPKIDPKTHKVTQRAVTDGKQAGELGASLEEASLQRNEVNAIIVAKYDGEQPFLSSDLVAAGEDWRSNFPTGFMSGIIDRIVPVPMGTIDSARYLTNAQLNAKFPDAPKKSEKFWARVTKTIRSWIDWRAFCYSLCQEDVLIGYAIVACPDKYDWRPKLYRSDEGFVPDGTGQHVSSVQATNLNQDVLIHEFVKKIADKEVASDAGWKIEACIRSIDKAMPPTEDATKPRQFEDVIREGNYAASYSSKAKVIKWRHVFVAEPKTTEDGGEDHMKVSHFICDRDSKEVLFDGTDELDSMSDFLTLFTLQPGNGKFYGSKGAGKILVNLHIAIERARNMAVDQLQVGGLKLMKGDPKGNPTLQLRVRHPFAIVQSDATFADESIPTNVEDFLTLDNKLVSIAEQAANAYIPNKLATDTGNADRTATEAAIDNARDQQAKVAYLARFFGQLGELVSVMTRKLCDPETIDSVAKEFQKALKEQDGLSAEEIADLAKAPAIEVVQDMAATDGKQILQAAAAFRGNPFVNQEKLMKRELTAMTNPAVADDLFLPDAVDATVEAEQIRQQMVENEMFMLGTSMPVSPRDAHAIHLKVAAGELKRAEAAVMKNAASNPSVLDHINTALVHMQAHIDMTRAPSKQGSGKNGKGPQGKLPPDIQPFQDFVNAWDEKLKAIALQHAKAQDQEKAAQAHAAKIGQKVLELGRAGKLPPELAATVAAHNAAMNGGQPNGAPPMPVMNGAPPAAPAQPDANEIVPTASEVAPPGADVVMPPRRT